MAMGSWKLLLLTFLLTSTFAHPSTISTATRAFQQASTATEQKHTLWKRLRNTLVEHVWGIPDQSGRGPKTIVSTSLTRSIPTRRYDSDVVLRFTITTENDAQAFREASEILYLDIWATGEDWVDVRVARDVLPSLLGLLPASFQNAHQTLIHDLHQAVYDTYPTKLNTETWRNTDTVRTSSRDLFFQDYQRLEVIYPWLRLVSSMFPDRSEVFSIGTSAEGREILAVRIGAPRLQHSADGPRRTILLMSGSHAREWIGVSSTAYIAQFLMTRYDPDFCSHDRQSCDVTELLDHYDVVIIPVLNPDGYAYTWSTDRLWRKSRQDTPLAFCPGLDLDRSFGIHWDDSSSDNACSDSYAGARPFQAVEARLLAEWARNQTRDGLRSFSAFLDFHSYSQQILYPYSSSCQERPPNLEDLEEVALGLAKSFRLVNGHFYSVTAACRGTLSVLGEAQGGSALDYFYAEADVNVKYSYQIKLRDTGAYGFLLPKKNIVPTGREAAEAVVALGQWLLGDRGIESESEQSQRSSHRPSGSKATETETGTPSTIASDSTQAQVELGLGQHHSTADVWNAQRDQATNLRSHITEAHARGAEDADWEREYDAELFRRR